MCADHVEEKRELIQAILKDRHLSNIPKITQVIDLPKNREFLEEHVGENSRLVIIKNAGHAVNLEKPKEFAQHLKAFLANFSSSSPLEKQHSCTNKAE
ncbi:unnamed protein product [Ilex paraguariensis]